LSLSIGQPFSSSAFSRHKSCYDLTTETIKLSQEKLTRGNITQILLLTPTLCA